MVEALAPLGLGGLIGYALGKDGRVRPVTQEMLIKLLRDTKPEFIKKVDIDTSVARVGDESDGCYSEAGSFLIVLNPATPTTTVYIKLNEPGWPALPISGSNCLRRIAGPFYRFFIKNTAGAGVLNLIVARHFQFQFIEGEVAASVSLALNDLTDLSVAAPTNLYILYWNATDSKWECAAITNFPHKAAHQDGGGDEISVAGLSGLLADDQHVLDAEVLAVAAALAHKTRHQDGGADEISVAGLAGQLAEAQTPSAHKTSHQDGGADELSVAGLSGLLADDQHILDAEVTAVAIAKALVTEQGDIIYASGASTPAALAHGTSGQALLTGGHSANPSWGAPAPATHASTHQDGGADEINCTGLVGATTVVRKTADETVNNSDTLQDDDELLLAIGANEVWDITIIVTNVSATATPDMKVGVTMPAGGAFRGIFLGWDTDTTVTNKVIQEGGFADVLAAASERTQIIRGIAYNGATAGNFQFRWCQVVATAENTKVLANSCIIAHRVA